MAEPLDSINNRLIKLTIEMDQVLTELDRLQEVKRVLLVRKANITNDPRDILQAEKATFLTHETLPEPHETIHIKQQTR